MSWKIGLEILLGFMPVLSLLSAGFGARFFLEKSSDKSVLFPSILFSLFGFILVVIVGLFVQWNPVVVIIGCIDFGLFIAVLMLALGV
jgi:hypothetical protein